MPLVSKSEAARLVGVTRQTIHRKVKAGELSATGGEIDTSELIRVFGAISDGTQPVTGTSQPDSAVQTTLQARVDGLESQLAVTREQLADTSKDRDEWREIAKEATSNVKLITNQSGTAKSNDNMIIFIGVAFIVGLGLAYMMLRNDVTPSDAMPLPAPVENQSEEQGAAVTDSVTPELKTDTAGLVTDPELIERLRYLQAKKVKTIWTIEVKDFPKQVKSLEQIAEEENIDLSLLQSIDITDKDIADYWDRFGP